MTFNESTVEGSIYILAVGNIRSCRVHGHDKFDCLQATITVKVGKKNVYMVFIKGVKRKKKGLMMDMI